MALSEEKRKALNGELYHAFTPELVRERRRCAHACHRFNTAGEVSRRRIVELWRECVIPKSLEDNTKHHRSTWLAEKIIISHTDFSIVSTETLGSSRLYNLRSSTRIEMKSFSPVNLGSNLPSTPTTGLTFALAPMCI